MIGLPGGAFFVAALVLMALIGAVEAIGLGGAAVGVDLHADGHVDGDFGDLLGWLGVGRLPLLMLLVVFLGVFAVLGLAGQQAVAAGLGAAAPAWVAVPVAAIAALPVTGLAARGLARVLPHDETSAVDLDTLVGREGCVVVGRAAAGSPARVRVADRHGQPHFVMAEPNNPAERFAEGDAVLLVRRDGHLFFAIGRGDALMPTLGF